MLLLAFWAIGRSCSQMAPFDVETFVMDTWDEGNEDDVDLSREESFLSSACKKEPETEIRDQLKLQALRY